VIVPSAPGSGSDLTLPLTLDRPSVIVISSISPPRHLGTFRMKPMRALDPSIRQPNSALRTARLLTNSKAPRSEYSGSVQPILSTMLPHNG
jgi:hypothetical protein